ncbi:MAG: bifunctional serine/threonine-protein kinase/formylglycine-generating enzyme family protein [Acidobacteriota bacterium]|nr:bifunctional serine/threonine-protein kinase/formylglycine-generating enzyme family protein [Acidobacteriota bacterium]
MEYVDGETIDRWCAHTRPSLRQLSSIFASVCSAVAYAHEQGILHRDIKPQNIMITADNQPKLLDFGIAVQDRQTSITADGLSPMTPAYAAPERLRGGPVTQAADIYSLALVFLKLICGKTPKPGGLSPERLLQQAGAQRLKADLPALFHCLVTALDEESAKRPSVEQFRQSLLDDRGAGSPPHLNTLQNRKHAPAVSSTATTDASPAEHAETCLIPAGPFLMGSVPEATTPRCETPQHEIHLPAFYMARYPVTNAQYAVFLKANKDRAGKNAWLLHGAPADRLDHPVTDVSWYDADAYCRWLSDISGRRYRLPGEAEWEKAAGGLDGRRYPWGSQWDPSLCFQGNSTTAVSRFQEGPFGCCQMAGHIQEWTNTRWGNDPIQCDYPYPYRADDGRETQTAAFHIHRGGAFRDPQERIGCRTRGWSHPNGTFNWRGFRVLREA